MRSSDDRSHLADLMLPVVAAAALLFAGRGLLSRPETMESLQAKLRHQPTNSVLHEQLGALLEKAGRHDDAIAHYRTALQFNPESVTAPCGISQALAAAGDLLEAQRTLEKSLKLHPDDPATNEALANLAVKSLGDIALPTAQKYYETALRADPTRPAAALQLSKIYLAQGRKSDAFRIIRPALAANDRDNALHLQMGTVYALVNEFDLAATEFNTVTARDPQNAEAWCTWGVALVAANKPSPAETILRRAVELKPDNPLYHTHLARALRDQGRYADADKEFSAAFEKDNHNVPVLLEWAETYRTLHDEKRAESILRSCANLNPKDNRARVALAVFLTICDDPARRDLWSAATILQSCVDDSKEPDVTLLAAAADGWARVEDYDRALNLLDRALSWGDVTGLPVETREALLDARQLYTLAAASPLPANEKWLGIQGHGLGKKEDEVWPNLPQPSVGTLSSLPSRVGEVPGPGSAFDPALFMGEAVKPSFQTIGIRP